MGSTMEQEEYQAKQHEWVRKYFIGGKDDAGRVITKIYLKNDECVAYEAEDNSGTNTMHFSAHGRTPERDSEFDHRFATFGPLYQNAVSSLYKSWNANQSKRRLAQTIYSHIISDRNEEENLFEKFINDLDTGYNKVNSNKITFAFTHFLFLIISIISIVMVCRNYSVDALDKNIFWCIIGSVIGGYLMTTIGSSKLLFTPEDATRRYVFYAFERNVMSVFLGVAAFSFSKSGLALSFLTHDESSNVYMILILGIISGYFHTFIPSLLFNAKEKFLANK